jgi:hypothetical protein
LKIKKKKLAMYIDFFETELKIGFGFRLDWIEVRYKVDVYGTQFMKNSTLNSKADSMSSNRLVVQNLHDQTIWNPV